MTLYLQNVLGLSALDSGLVYAPGAALIFVVSAASAQLTARVPAGTVVVAGLGLVAAGLALMLIVGPHSSWAAILPGDLVVCFGTGLFNPALAMLALGASSGDDSGLMAGVNDVFRQGGMALGVAALGALIPAAAALGRGGADAYVNGLHHALLIGAGVAITGAVLTAALLSRRRAGETSRETFAAVEPVVEIA
jgi:hypothetical protein